MLRALLDEENTNIVERCSAQRLSEDVRKLPVSSDMNQLGVI